MAKRSVAPDDRPCLKREEHPHFPNIFDYDVLAESHGLEQALKALRKLARLSTLVQRGGHSDATADDVLIGDAELLDELATAVECAVYEVCAIHEKAVA